MLIRAPFEVTPLGGGCGLLRAPVPQPAARAAEPLMQLHPRERLAAALALARPPQLELGLQLLAARGAGRRVRAVATDATEEHQPPLCAIAGDDPPGEPGKRRNGQRGERGRR